MDVTAKMIFDGESIPISRNHRLIGFYINARDTHCSLSMGDEDDRYSVSLYYQRLFEPDKPLKVFIPVPDGITTSTLDVTRAPVKSSGTGMFSSAEPDRDAPCRMSLISLLFWDKPGFSYSHLKQDERSGLPLDTDHLTKKILESSLLV